MLRMTNMFAMKKHIQFPCLTECDLDEDVSSSAPELSKTRLQPVFQPPTGQPVHGREGESERWMEERGRVREGEKNKSSHVQKATRGRHTQPPRTPSGHTHESIELCMRSLAKSMYTYI